MEPPNEEIMSKYVSKDVFLSHSGKQKYFVRQLHRDLTEEGVSCFFDESHESLPLAEKWPWLIFQAVRTCKVAVLLLSMDFIESKWPMLELSAFLEAKRFGANSNLKILPLFFKISPKDLTSDKQDSPDRPMLEKPEETRIKWKQDLKEWKQDLKEVRTYNGLSFKEDKGEESFRDEIRKEILKILEVHTRYFVPSMQGETRMCEEVEALFNNVPSSGVPIAGLYGLAGSGKTTLSKAFCNFNLKAFEEKVCYLDFQSGGPLERVRHALQYLILYPEAEFNSLPTKEKAWEMLHQKACGQKVLLALDNITEDPEIMEEIKVYTGARFARESRILLIARSLKIMQTFNCSYSCRYVPSLSGEEAIFILTGCKASVLRAKERVFALKCATRCCVRKRTVHMAGVRMFHPLALKAFGRYLMDKFDTVFSKWSDELFNFPMAMADDLQDVFTILEISYNDMIPEHRAIFILLVVYRLSKMSLHQVLRQLAIVCEKEENCIKNAVKSLIKKAFIERIEPEIGIHDLLVEFALKKVKGDIRHQLFPNEDMSQNAPMVEKEILKSLLSLQLEGMQVMENLDLRVECVTHISVHNCRRLQNTEGMDRSGLLEIRHVKPGIELSILRRFHAVQYLKIEIRNYVEPGKDGKPVKSEEFCSQLQLGDLTGCGSLKEIYVCCPFLSEFPTIKGLQRLEKVKFSDCFIVTGPFDCTGCSKLQSIELNFCSQMADSPKIDGCSKLSRIVLWQCDAVKKCPEMDGLSKLQTFEICISSEADWEPLRLDSCSGLNNLQLWNVEGLKALPDFKPLSSLTTLRLHRFCITEPPELTFCPSLEDVSFFTLKKLERFPKFSGLRALKKLCLCNCTRVSAPPDIAGCSQLQLFHLLYNDNMEGLPQMNDCLELEEIKLSWLASEKITYEGIDPHSWKKEDGGEDLEFFLNYWRDEIVENSNDYIIPEPLKECRWIQDKQTMVKRYVRGMKHYYSITAPYKIEVKSSPPVAGLTVDNIRTLRIEREIEWTKAYYSDLYEQESLSEAAICQPCSLQGLSEEDHLERRISEQLWLATWEEWEQILERILGPSSQMVSKERWMEWNNAWQQCWSKKWRNQFEKEESIAGEEMLGMIRKIEEWELQFKGEIESEIERVNLDSTWDREQWVRKWEEKVERYIEEDKEMKMNGYRLNVFDFPGELIHDDFFESVITHIIEVTTYGRSYSALALLNMFTKNGDISHVRYQVLLFFSLFLFLMLLHMYVGI